MFQNYNQPPHQYLNNVLFFTLRSHAVLRQSCHVIPLRGGYPEGRNLRKELQQDFTPILFSCNRNVLAQMTEDPKKGQPTRPVSWLSGHNLLRDGGSKRHQAKTHPGQAATGTITVTSCTSSFSVVPYSIGPETIAGKGTTNS